MHHVNEYTPAERLAAARRFERECESEYFRTRRLALQVKREASHDHRARERAVERALEAREWHRRAGEKVAFWERKAGLRGT